MGGGVQVLFWWNITLKVPKRYVGVFEIFEKYHGTFFILFGGWGVPRANFEKYHGTFLYFFCSFGQISSKFLQNFFKYSLNFLYFLFNIFFKILFNIFLQHFSSTLFFEISLTFFQNFFKFSSKKRGVGGVEGKFRKVPWYFFVLFFPKGKVR